MSINTFRFRGNIFIMNLREFLGEDDCGSEIWFHSNQRITLHSNRKQDYVQIDYVSFKEIDDSNRLLTLDWLVRMSERCPLGVITLCDQWSFAVITRWQAWSSCGSNRSSKLCPSTRAILALSSHYPLRAFCHHDQKHRKKAIDYSQYYWLESYWNVDYSGESCVKVVWELLGLSSINGLLFEEVPNAIAGELSKRESFFR